MLSVLKSRRAFIGFVSIVALTIIGVCKGIDVSNAIASVAIAVAAANAVDKKEANHSSRMTEGSESHGTQERQIEKDVQGKCEEGH